MSVTLAAQMGAFPICIYYFHQFPNLFLITNMLAVPLSTIILFGEILLLMLAWIPLLAKSLGFLLAWLIKMMNNAILYFDGLTFAVWEPIFASVLSTWILYTLLISSCSYLLQKKRQALWVSIGLLSCFIGLQIQKQIAIKAQRTMIVYNVSGKAAVDFIVQDQYIFVGDSGLKADAMLQQFHLKPARTSLLASKEVSTLDSLLKQEYCFAFYNKTIGMMSDFLSTDLALLPKNMDVLILSKNTRVELNELLSISPPHLLVIDASNSLWKTAEWKKIGAEFNVPVFVVAEQGAYVMKLR